MKKLVKKRTPCDKCPALNGSLFREFCCLGFKIKQANTGFAGIAIPYPDEPCLAPKTIKEYVELALERQNESKASNPLLPENPSLS